MKYLQDLDKSKTFSEAFWPLCGSTYSQVTQLTLWSDFQVSWRIWLGLTLHSIVCNQKRTENDEKFTPCRPLWLQCGHTQPWSRPVQRVCSPNWPMFRLVGLGEISWCCRTVRNYFLQRMAPNIEFPDLCDKKFQILEMIRGLRLGILSLLTGHSVGLVCYTCSVNTKEWKKSLSKGLHYWGIFVFLWIMLF